MEEPIFIEKTMEHACIYFLFLLGLGLFESLHDFNKFADLLVHLGWVS